MSMSMIQHKHTLYSWAASDCSARIRIALALKQIPYDIVEVDLGKGERTQDNVNPSRTVPTLIITTLDGKEVVSLAQSVAALEYLDEAYPSLVGLMPSLAQPEERAMIKTLMQVITTDIHPLTTPRVAEAVRKLSSRNGTVGAEADAVKEWDLNWMRRGFSVYEKLLKSCGGSCSVGNSLTLADVCLWPAVSTARKMGLDVEEEFPGIGSLIENLKGIEAFRDDAHASTSLNG